MKQSKLSGISRKQANIMIKFKIQAEKSVLQQPSAFHKILTTIIFGMTFSLTRNCSEFRFQVHFLSQDDQNSEFEESPIFIIWKTT